MCFGCELDNNFAVERRDLGNGDILYACVQYGTYGTRKLCKDVSECNDYCEKRRLEGEKK